MTCKLQGIQRYNSSTMQY